jgi:hypothetical protein
MVMVVMMKKKRRRRRRRRMIIMMVWVVMMRMMLMLTWPSGVRAEGPVEDWLTRVEGGMRKVTERTTILFSSSIGIIIIIIIIIVMTASDASCMTPRHLPVSRVNPLMCMIRKEPCLVTLAG